MGRKKKKPSKPWCWYCNRDFDDEKILLQHQKAKHFKCHICHKKLYTGPGLSIHCMQVHKETLDRVPNSLPNRGNIEIEIYGMEGIPESDIRDHEAQKQAGRITTAAGADSSDEEGGSSAKRVKTAQPAGQESTGPSIPSLGSMPITPMLASPFMGMGPMNPYLGHLSIPMMGSVPQMPLPGGAASSPQTPSKPLFASSSSPSSSNSASKPAFAAYSSGGAAATIVGESTVPKKSGVIATQAGSSKIMHPEEDLSLAKLRARLPRYQRNSVPTSMPQMSVASPQNTTVGPLLENQALSVQIFSQLASREDPILVVVRQQKAVLSWQLPLLLETSNGWQEYSSVSRQLCTEPLDRNVSVEHEFFLDVSTSDTENLSFVASVSPIADFVVGLNENHTVALTASEPKYYRFRFPEDIENVLLTVMSDDNYCMSVSVQNLSVFQFSRSSINSLAKRQTYPIFLIKCPVFDMDRDLKYGGIWQTVMSKTGMTISRERFPFGFFLVFVAKADDYECTGERNSPPSLRQKTVHFVIHEKIVNDTGDQDLCYFNFLCSHPLGDLTDFNHVYSNIGYVLLGFLFIINTARRDVRRRQPQANHDLLENVNIAFGYQISSPVVHRVLSRSFTESLNTTAFFMPWEQH
uniref:EOG090X0A5X n=1 Tax=Daphnia magna TaxID=35525 RepID=A0A4Y7MKB5_9CRUS|nr:EOG090X0A5X [Daphnia magna]